LLLPSLSPFVKTVIYALFIIFLLESFSFILPIKLNIDKAAIDTLLAAIASIMGVFLGLLSGKNIQTCRFI
jgi:hypothetical protein